MDLSGSRTHENLKQAFARESMANRRFLYFAETADVDGFPDIAANLREAAAGGTGHANGHLEYLTDVGDPVTGHPMGETIDNLGAVVAGEHDEYTELYPTMAETARQEGFTEIADWFESLAKAAEAHAGRFQKLLDELS